MIPTIHHFDQQALLAYECDSIDLLLLEWLDDGMTTHSLPEAQIGTTTYYLVNALSIEDDLPLLHLQPRSIQQRLSALTRKDILSRISIGKGNKTDIYYGTGLKWSELKPES